MTLSIDKFIEAKSEPTGIELRGTAETTRLSIADASPVAGALLREVPTREFVGAVIGYAHALGLLPRHWNATRDGLLAGERPKRVRKPRAPRPDDGNGTQPLHA